MSLRYEPSSEPLHLNPTPNHRSLYQDSAKLPVMYVYDSYRITDWERMLKPDRYPKPSTSSQFKNNYFTEM